MSVLSPIATTAAHDERRYGVQGRLGLSGGLLLQAILVLYLFDGQAGTWVLSLCLGACALGVMPFLSVGPFFRAIFGCLGFGGLGMMAGLALTDMGAHLHHQSFTAMVFSPMSGLMILFCLPFCVTGCERFGDKSSRAVRGALGILGMMGGMVLGAQLLSHSLSALGMSAGLAHYCGMLIGMTFGQAMAVFAGVWMTQKQAK